MSFYGEQPKLNELNFKFDAYYPNRKALANALSTLNANATLPPLVGSYVLVSYYINPDSPNTTDLSILFALYTLGFEKYKASSISLDDV